MTDTAAGAPKSTFVTILAWFCVACFGLGVLICTLQNVMLYFLMPETLPIPEDQLRQVPAAMRWMLGNFRLLFLAALLFVAFMLALSIALLKRHNWARIAFIAVLGLGILWNFVGLYLGWAMMGDMASPVEFQQFTTIVVAVSVLFTLLFTALHGWIMWKLMTPDIKREFLS